MASSAAQIAALPDDVRQVVGPHLAEDRETLDAIGDAIRERRDDAKAARAASGIEETWRICEEAYVGIDDANRGEFAGSKWSKPNDPSGPVDTGRRSTSTDMKSTAFVRLTSRYVDAGAAKLGEILLPVDDKAFSFTETPDPRLIKAKDDTSHVHHDGLGAASPVPLWRPAKQGETPATGPAAVAGAPPSQPAAAPVAAPAGGAVLAAGAVAPPTVAPPPGMAPPAGAAQAMQPPPGHVPLTVKDLVEEKIELAREKAKKAETRIYDWMIECQYPAEMRKLIFDAARCGVGVLKAPYAKPTKDIAVQTRDDDSIVVEIVKRISPAAKWVDFWNIYPDPACGENIQSGDFIFEMDWISERQVREFKNTPGYITKQIDRVILDGPEKVSGDAKEQQGERTGPKAEHKDRYQIWYYYGALSRDEVSAIWTASGKKLSKDDAAETKESVYAIVTMIGDHVVRATINPLDSGKFPYHSVPWQRRAGHWAGMGVAEQIAVPQRIVNAATRAMLNNAGISGGVQIIINQSAITPADTAWPVTPNKVWYDTGEGADDVRKNFMAIEIPNVTDHMMKIIEYGMQLGEESTSIPLVTQGQSGKTTPDTYGATQLQDNNANQLLRSIGYNWDDFITEPVVRQFYEWLLLDPDVPADEKGDFTINAHGSAALVERAIQDQAIAQMAPLAVPNNAFGIDPKRWFKILSKSKRIDPKELIYTEAEQAKIDAQPPPQAPQIQVATINQDTQMKLLAAKQPAEQQTAENEQRIAQAAQILEGHNIDTERYQIDKRYEIELLRYATARHISIDQAKVELAKTTMTLQMQKELNAQDNAVDLHKHHNPPQEPRKPRPQRGAKPVAQTPGRAGNERAFEQGPRQ